MDHDHPYHGHPHWAPAGQGSGALVLARYLLGFRTKIAPRGSRRERLLRQLYVPLITRLRDRARDAALGGAPTPSVVRYHSLASRGAELPEAPRIAILKLDHIGDFIVALPAFEHLRATWPRATITLICSPWIQSWADTTGLFDTVVPFNFFPSASADWRGARAEQFAAFAALPLGSFDLAIDLRHDPDTRLLLSRIDAPLRAGFCAPVSEGGECLDISLPDLEHITVAAGTGRAVQATLRLRLLAHAVTESLLPCPAPAACLTGPDNPKGDGGRYLVLAPGAGSPIRVWPVSRLIEVGRAIADRHGLDIVVTGSAADSEAAEAIVQAFPDRTVRNLAGTLPLAGLPAVIAGATLYVGYDTGPTHLAASLDVPTVAILSGVPNLDVWHPVGKHVAVVAGVIACSPCYLKQVSECPYGVPCLMAVTTEDVLAACDSLLARPVGARPVGAKPVGAEPVGAEPVGARPVARA